MADPEWSVPRGTQWRISSLYTWPPRGPSEQFKGVALPVNPGLKLRDVPRGTLFLVFILGLSWELLADGFAVPRPQRRLLATV